MNCCSFFGALSRFCLKLHWILTDFIWHLRNHNPVPEEMGLKWQDGHGKSAFVYGLVSTVQAPCIFFFFYIKTAKNKLTKQRKGLI